MARKIIYGSSACAAAVAVVVTTVLLLGARKGVETPAAQAQSPRADDRPVYPGTTRDPVRVTTISPTVEDLHRVTSQPAQVEAYEQTTVYAKASGFLAKVLVDIGDRVEKDQVLAELWIPEMVQEQLQKAALVDQAHAAVDQSQARLGSTDALIAAAEAKLAETHAFIDQHEADIAFRRSEHRRILELVANRSVNDAIQDEKLKQLRAAEAALAAAHAQVKSAEAGVKVEHAQKLQARADVAHAQSRLKVAEADLRHTEILIDYAQIRAPYAGMITRRWVHSGDFVASAANSKSEPLFTVDRVDTLRIVFDVPEAESALIQNGQRASLVVDALKGRSFDGRIVRSAGVLDPKTRTLRVEAELDQPDVSLRAGMFGMMTVTLAARSQAVMLSARCLHYEGGNTFVFCAENGVVEKHAVTIGYSDGARVEILDGLGAESLVISDSRAPLQAGRPVEVGRNR